MTDRWHVELSEGAVESLKALPRDERALVAARLDHLAEVGPPEGAGDAQVIGLPAGAHVLMCVRDVPGRRVVIVTLEPAGVRVRPTVGRLFRRALPRRLTEWMGGEGMGSIAHDVRFALRSLRRSPGFSVAAVLTLSLGIGASDAIFSVADGVLLTPLPYDDPDEVVTLWTSWDNFPV